jgi:hypothetical protein
MLCDAEEETNQCKNKALDSLKMTEAARPLETVLEVVWVDNSLPINSFAGLRL